MQMKEVVISITGLQQGPDGPDTMELVTVGKYGAEQDKILITWEESELTGMEGTHTSFTVTPGSITMTREGTVNTTMVFEEGKKNYFLYETQAGATTMGVDTYRMRAELNSHGGQVELDYSIDVDQRLVNRVRFFIEIKEPEKSHIGDIQWPI